MEFTGGKYIESESIIVKYETMKTEGDGYNNFIVLISVLDIKRTQDSQKGVINIMGISLKRYGRLIFLEL